MKQPFLILLLILMGHTSRLCAQLYFQPQYSVQDAGIGTPLLVNQIQLGSGITVEYAEQGRFDGTAVIFLHGLGDSWHSFESVFSILPEHIHAFAISQRGHGNSDKPVQGYGPDVFAEDIAAFMKAKQLVSAFIVGHSMGGLIAQQFALSHPSFVRGLVIVGSDANFRNNPGLPAFYNNVLKMQAPIERAFMDEFQRSTLFNPIDPAVFNKLVDESMKIPLPVFKAVCTGLFNCDLSKKIRTIKKPALVLWGENDNMCSISDQQQIVAAIRKSTLNVYAKTGHALHWEKPQQFGIDLENFIKNNTSPTK